MQNKPVEDFFYSAVNYCDIGENFASPQTPNNLKALLVSLLDLYTKALYLPEVEPENDNFIDFKISIPKIEFNQFDHYWEVFNPYFLEEPVGASLSDDILDFYKDIKRGILLYEQKEQIEAIWHWKFQFDIHWGNHAVDTLRVLHSAIFK
ncbi:DUF5063 domain-containing protein [Neobacillus terrae]|uniref:DUF5063 domain-containing protein n=1 Tax=Neobacillus terrae TaxID=3034837 RepID=UPI001407769B|nr:DUF5063 domain-containing protein [Neobacillus terrae]NHM33831.1 DUF5063 domain-containing protein [Neobacillus terrae]